MTFAQLLVALSGAPAPAAVAERTVAAVCIDSRRVVPDALFVAVPGTKADGTAFASEAFAAGAALLVGEGPAPAGVPAERWISVPDARRAVALLAAEFHGQPSHHLAVYGVTGTNGKTTTATLLRAVLQDAGTPCGLLSTVQCNLGDRWIPSDQTTPDATVLQAHLAAMLASGCRAASVEVSSHALVQHRVTGVRFAAAAFTNLTRDHIDFHGDMEAYGLAKRRLFEQLAESPSALAVINLDDAWGRSMLAWLRESAIPTVTYGFDAAADFRAEDVHLDTRQTRFCLVFPGGARVDMVSPLLGRHNVSNLLAVAGLATAAGVAPAQLATTFAAQPPVRGRLERVETPHHPATLFVDYAHTPDAIEHVLETLRELTTGRLIIVFGCGGDRDRGKRSLMGGLAHRLADIAVVTSDNPRSESPSAILDEILTGVPANTPGAKIVVQADRREAIRTALHLATESSDIVLVAGKGHETTQIFADRSVHFDDREELLRLAAQDR